MIVCSSPSLSYMVSWKNLALLAIHRYGHLLWRADSLEKTLMLGKIEGRRSGWPRMRWLDGITDSMDMNLSKLWEIVKNREVWHAVIQGHRELNVTEWLNNKCMGRCMSGFIEILPFVCTSAIWDQSSWVLLSWVSSAYTAWENGDWASSFHPGFPQGSSSYSGWWL